MYKFDYVSQQVEGTRQSVTAWHPIDQRVLIRVSNADRYLPPALREAATACLSSRTATRDRTTRR